MRYNVGVKSACAVVAKVAEKVGEGAEDGDERE